MGRVGRGVVHKGRGTEGKERGTSGEGTWRDA